jgi:hypothetical protein
METTGYDLVKREDKSTIWLETAGDLNSAKSRIKQIASFWPGRYEVVEQQSQRVVAASASSARLRVALAGMREYANKFIWASYEWLLAPAPVVAGLAAYTRMQKYARTGCRRSYAWLRAPMAHVPTHPTR